MYAGQIMHTELVTVFPTSSLEEARILTQKHKIDHLLVINQERKLVGILSDRDLKRYCASPATTLTIHELNYLLQQVIVDMVMNRTVITITPDTTMERAAALMLEHDINALPVMEKKELVGIVTSTDVMGVLLRAIGISEESCRLTIPVHEGIGSIADVCSLLKIEQINIQSLFSWPETVYPDIALLIMRIARKDEEKAIAVLQRNGFKVMTSYTKDILPYLPA